ncbi:hypothetical protein Tco_1249544, partial [Tanacetum coccineum]
EDEKERSAVVYSGIRQKCRWSSSVFGRSEDALHVCLAEALMAIWVFGRSADGLL